MQVIIYDTEFTAWEGSLQRKWGLDWEAKELIQFAAYRIQILSNEINVLDKINLHVKPVKNPQLSNYIMDLTKISQQDVNAGEDPSAFFHYLKSFTKNGDIPIFSWGNDIHVLEETAQINQHNIDWINSYNLIELFSLCDIPTNVNSGRLHELFGGHLDIVEHNALGDVESLAFSLNALSQSHPEKVINFFSKTLPT